MASLRRTLNRGRRFPAKVERELAAGDYTGFLAWARQERVTVDWDSLSLRSGAKASLKVPQGQLIVHPSSS